MRQSIIQSDPVSRILEDRMRSPVRLGRAFADRLPAAGAQSSGDESQAYVEGHWDVPLPLRVRMGGGPVLRTLRDVDEFLAARPVMLEHSATFRDTMQAVARAARTGSPDDVAHAALRIQDYIGCLIQKDERRESQVPSRRPEVLPAWFAPRRFRR